MLLFVNFSRMVDSKEVMLRMLSASIGLVALVVGIEAMNPNYFGAEYQFIGPNMQNSSVAGLSLSFAALLLASALAPRSCRTPRPPP